MNIKMEVIVSEPRNLLPDNLGIEIYSLKKFSEFVTS